MWRRLARWLPFLRRRPPGGNGLVKVAGFQAEGEARTWAEALRHQGIRAEVRLHTGDGKRQETRPPEWEVWVRQGDEPQARLVLGLSGHSVIRLPRQRAAGKE